MPSRTNLTRTALSEREKVLLAAGSLGRDEEYGAKTQLSALFGVSRPTVYAAKQTAAAVLGEHFRRAKDGSIWVRVDEAQVARAVVALRVLAPNSLRAIEGLLPILYPGITWSYGKIQSITAEAEQKAALWNKQVDLSGISAGALDEMYSQGQPVLAGVDLDHGYLFSLALRESRSGEDWAQVLNVAKGQGVMLKTAVKDAALGIAAGVREIWPEAEQRDDCFHAHYEMGKVQRLLAQRAYAAISHQEGCRKDLETLRRTGRGPNRWALVNKENASKRRCKEKLALHDPFEKAMWTAQEAMEIVDLEQGRLRTAEEASATIAQSAKAMRALDDPRCRQVGRYIENRAPGLTTYMNQVNEELSGLMTRHGINAVLLACVIIRLVSDLARGRRPGMRTKVGDKCHLLGAFALLRKTLGTSAEVLLAEVDAVFVRRHRASSAVEGFNAALRPHLYVQKGVSQGFLDLFRAYYNLRQRRWGRHKGTSPHECLTGESRPDWLSLLGYPPS